MEKDKTIVLIVLAGAVTMLAIVSLVLYLVFTHRKRYLIQQNELLRLQSQREIENTKAIINTQERERGRIAQNLHDTIGADLSIVQFNITKYIHELKNSECNIQSLSNDVLILANTIESIRNICHDLFPLTIERQGLIGRIKQSVERLNESGKIRCSFSGSSSESSLPFTSEDKINLLRVYMEIVNNIIKHASASDLTIVSNINTNQYTLELSHNGAPFSDADALENMIKKKGLGLSSILNRTEIMGGSIAYSTENGYSKVKVTIPYKNA
ncbi:MAG: histidine kinase [Bacteroidia bacterium]|jgi:signal transduction histidine kinase|nr:histidine kinase [Bacteroidia bacterium]